MNEIPLSPAERDDHLQRAVLLLLLDHHPAPLADTEIAEMMTAHPDGQAERDDIANALRDLAGARLVHRLNEFAFPTHAAVRFRELNA